MNSIRHSLLLACALVGAAFSTASYADRDGRDWQRHRHEVRHEVRHDRHDRYDRRFHSYRYEPDRRIVFVRPAPVIVHAPIYAPPPIYAPRPIVYPAPPPGIWISTPDIFLRF